MNKIETMTASALSTLIGRIGKTTVLRERMIQQAAVQCVIQSLLHSNVTPAMQLYEVAGKGSRRDSLVAYLEVWGQIAYLKSEGKLGFYRREALCNEVIDEAGAIKDEYLEKITTALWYNAKPEPKIKSVFDADKEISGVLERLSKQAGKPGVEVAGKGLLNHMIEAYNRFSFDAFTKTTTGDMAGQEAADKVNDHAEGNELNADPAKLAELQAHFQPLKAA